MSAISPADERSVRAASPEEVRSGGGLMIAGANFLSALVPLIAIMLLWEVAVRLSDVPPAILPPLSSIFKAIAKMVYEGTLWGDISATLYRLIKSAVAGMVIGTILGVLMGYFRIWERALVVPMKQSPAQPCSRWR
jgi:ABC-type nitrate/sulfonate/bicarbonate transport system permease component